jgi:hypothetical protein
LKFASSFSGGSFTSLAADLIIHSIKNTSAWKLPSNTSYSAKFNDIPAEMLNYVSF